MYRDICFNDHHGQFLSSFRQSEDKPSFLYTDSFKLLSIEGNA